MTNRERKIGEIEKLLAKLESLENKIAGRKNKIAIVRLIIFLTGVAAFFISYISVSATMSYWLLAIFIIPFSIVSIIQTRLINFQIRINAYIEIQKSYLARANLDWKNIPYTNTEEIQPVSPLELDLDLCGQHSLHHLIDFSKSVDGSFHLRKLLSEHDLSRGKIIHRQDIIKELKNFYPFRNKFLVTTALTSKGNINSGKIADWIGVEKVNKWLPRIFSVLLVNAMLNYILVILHLANILTGWWALSFFIYLAIYILSNKLVKNLSGDADFLQKELGKYSQVFEFIENFDLRNNKELIEFCSPIRQKGVKPSVELNKILKIVSFLTFRNNPFVWPMFVALGPIDYYLAMSLEKIKSKVAAHYPAWMDVFVKLESFISIATFSSLNPEYSFPEISNGNEFKFDGKNVGHVLLPAENKVNNDFKFNSVGEIFIITGSNMSGKSTFLRTLGSNLCLSYAGGPVNAESFKISLMRIFSCIRLSDSVIDGISYFYAEVKRLKQLLIEIDSADSMPLFFLIDEIFKGTNNIERRIGSKSYIKSLVGKNAIGIVSTHDIELVELEKLSDKIVNYHFKEDIKNDKMNFDYKLRTGPCPTTNALKIMRLEGLPVENED